MMNFSLDDIAKGKRGPAEDSEFSVLDLYRQNSNVDGLAYDGGVAILANQINDCMLIFNECQKAIDTQGKKMRVPNATWHFPLKRPGSHGCDELW
jgi:hypothetical protein